MSIAENIARVREEMAAAAREAGRAPEEITLVGASKMNDAAACREAIAAGIDALGENRVQEMTQKLSENAYDGAPLHFIGHLQRNKVKQVVGHVSLIQSVGSLELLDEIEKAHPDVMNILLQILDDGRITDSQGRTVDFKNTVIVMTSNIGAKALTAAGAKLGFSAEEHHDPDAEKAFERAKETVMGELRQTFRPEFLNRIDDIIVFRALSEEDIREVARRMLRTVSARMETMGIHLDASDEAVAELAKEGFDPKYGARPLRRAIQSKVEDAVAEKMLDGTLKEGDTARLTVEDDKLCVTK